MKINEPNRISGLQPYNPSKGQRAEQTGAAKRKDQVTISPEAKELLESNRINQAERAEQLKQLKQEVSSGTYHVEAGKIAEKLLPYLK